MMERIIERMEVKVEVLDTYAGLPLPAYQTEGSAGFDLLAAVTEDIEIAAGDTAMVPTGLKFALPRGSELQIRPRSGLAAKNGVTVLNAPGTIDSDYRGEVKVILINFGKEAFTVKRGMRIAQAVLSPYYRAELTPVAALDETDRGEGGFGHTGI